MIDWENPFKSSDFLNRDISPPSDSVSRYGLLPYQAKRISEWANARFRELLKDAPVVYLRATPGFPGFPHWTEPTGTRMENTCAHSARLICIEEIK